MLTYTFKFRTKAKRDGYLYDKIDRHNMLWNKMVWLEEVSQKRRKGQKNRHINGTVMNRYVNKPPQESPKSLDSGRNAA